VNKLWSLGCLVGPEQSKCRWVASSPGLLLLQYELSTIRSEEFLGGSSGKAMSCRLGMLTTMRRCVMCRGENFLEAIFSTVGLRGLISIPFILGWRKQGLLH
jgi:hypothetical protein